MIVDGIAVFRNVNLPVVVGKTLIVEFPVLNGSGVAVDVSTGYTAKVAGRLGKDDADATFEGDQTDLLTLASGKITLTLPVATTGALVLADGPGVFEIELTKDGGAGDDTVTSFASGTYTVALSAVHA